MNDPESNRAGGVSVGVVEVVVALLLAAIGGVVMVDSRRLGAGWADDGPQSGYFPFYVGLLLTVSGIVIAFRSLQTKRRFSQFFDRPFATGEQFRSVLAVLVPCAVYIGALPWLGIYVASAVFIGWFMARHGRFGVVGIAPVAIGVPLVFFLLFERWFLVPLPKGPLERMLGY